MITKNEIKTRVKTKELKTIKPSALKNKFIFKE